MRCDRDADALQVECDAIRGSTCTAGFPLTDAQLGRSFAVTSGHQPEATDWAALAQIDTLVVLMAGKNLDVLMHLLRDAEWDADKPASHSHEHQPFSSTWHAPSHPIEMPHIMMEGLCMLQVAVVRAAGQPEQAVWKGTVSTIAERTEGAGPLSPCVLIIGSVVDLDKLS